MSIHPEDSSTNSDSAQSPSAVRPNAKKGRFESLRALDKWWTILILLFCVTGILGLPILWVSKAYGPGMKALLSVIVTIYTGFLFWLVYLVIVFAYQSVADSVG